MKFLVQFALNYVIAHPQVVEKLADDLIVKALNALSKKAAK